MTPDLVRTLILGGTTEARRLGARLAQARRFDVTLSLAGRTRAPVDQGVPTRIGGFGGADGLARHLVETRVDLLVDATHPFAARISANAVAAATATGVPLLALRRPAWTWAPGDRWIDADSVAEALDHVGAAPRRLFVALGRQELEPLEAAPQHRYLVRSVDPVEPPLRVPHAAYLLDRGPFDVEAETALFERHGIEAVLAKNSGGAASRAKIDAARRLGLPVHLVRRPPASGPSLDTVEALLAAIDHRFPPTDRGE